MKPLDELYLEWLYAQTGRPVHDRMSARRTYWRLLRQLYTREFHWFVPNDDNRCSDGKDLRPEFIAQKELDVDPAWLDLPCSVLEMLVALSRALAFEGGGAPRDWFWEMIENLRIAEFNDYFYDGGSRSFDVIHDVIGQVMDRTYEPNGFRGLFPLRHAERDQTKVELWYQANAYLMERL